MHCVRRGYVATAKCSVVAHMDKRRFVWDHSVHARGDRTLPGFAMRFGRGGGIA